MNDMRFPVSLSYTWTLHLPDGSFFACAIYLLFNCPINGLVCFGIRDIMSSQSERKWWGSMEREIVEMVKSLSEEQLNLFLAFLQDISDNQEELPYSDC